MKKVILMMFFALSLGGMEKGKSPLPSDEELIEQCGTKKTLALPKLITLKKYPLPITVVFREYPKLTFGEYQKNIVFSRRRCIFCADDLDRLSEDDKDDFEKENYVEIPYFGLVVFPFKKNTYAEATAIILGTKNEKSAMKLLVASLKKTKLKEMPSPIF